MIVTQSGWSDYVFDKNYKPNTLGSVEHFINQSKHLPDVASAKVVGASGITQACCCAKSKN